MQDYIFILGRDPELSLLELASYFRARNMDFQIKETREKQHFSGHQNAGGVLSESETAVLISLPELDFAKIIKDLAGTVKIARVITNLDEEELYTGVSNKIKYAISSYDDSDIDELKEYLKKRMRQEKLKAVLKRSSREEAFLMPSDVVRHKLMGEGFEIVVYNNVIAKTVAVFNPYEYEKRDKERPLQRPLHMISIRLAKMLINLSGAKEKDVLLDPFCGYGILLQEAMLMGLDVIGIDKSRECSDASRKNLEFTAKKYMLQSRLKIFNDDSRRLSRFVIKVNAAATEPYMGPLLNKLPTKENALLAVKELSPLYEDVLKELSKSVSGNIAIIIPRFRLHTGERIKLNFERIIKEAGLKPVSIVPFMQFPVIYTAPDSKMEREVWVLAKA
ncbi:MAG: hypothetical protein KJ955_06710 [Nanoarchaeota archaeon]|nr:hypothetical protein [Nanoarchaeota archaeon]